MSALLVLAPLAATEDISFAEPDPHPELVRAQRPTVAEFLAAAVVLGVFPASSYLTGEPLPSVQGL